MKYGFAALAFAAGVLADGYGSSDAVVYTTDVVTEYTTYCPEATTISHGTWTYAASASETVTVTNCPCTITKPCTTATPSTIYYTSCQSSAASAASVVESNPASYGASYSALTAAYSNPLTVVYSTGESAPTGAAAPAVAVAFTGTASANKVGAVVVGLLAGVVAFAL